MTELVQESHTYKYFLNHVRMITEIRMGMQDTSDLALCQDQGTQLWSTHLAASTSDPNPGSKTCKIPEPV